MFSVHQQLEVSNLYNRHYGVPNSIALPLSRTYWKNSMKTTSGLKKSPDRQKSEPTLCMYNFQVYHTRILRWKNTRQHIRMYILNNSMFHSFRQSLRHFCTGHRHTSLHMLRHNYRNFLPRIGSESNQCCILHKRLSNVRQTCNHCHKPILHILNLPMHNRQDSYSRPLSN